jgi:hypothetical protein
MIRPCTNGMAFDTPLVLSGPLRRPRQMLAEQVYFGHASIHDDTMAEKLGFRAGPIEGESHIATCHTIERVHARTAACMLHGLHICICAHDSIYRDVCSGAWRRNQYTDIATHAAHAHSFISRCIRVRAALPRLTLPCTMFE